MQAHFQAVLKRRLQIETQNHPPLFPWEDELVDYPDSVEERSHSLVPRWVWMPQQSHLNLPLPLPEKVFQDLLAKCQGMVTSSLPLGAKIVRVVECFFPHDSETINSLAGLVLRTSYRSAHALDEIPNMERDYSDLQQGQQILLSLMAAKQLLDDLTLPLSSTNPVVEKQCLTSTGVLRLRVEFQFEGQLTHLRVHGNLPAPGILKLQAHGNQAVAKSTTGGEVSVELYSNQITPIYTLEVEFPDIDQQPLLFVISPTTI